MNFGKTQRILAWVGSFFDPCFFLPRLPIPAAQIRPMEYRHLSLVPTCKGLNPLTPDYEYSNKSIELVTTNEATNSQAKILTTYLC